MGILTYIKIGLAVLLIGVATYYVIDYKHAKAQVVQLQRQLEGYKRAVKILKDDMKQDKEDENEKAHIDNLTPEQLVDYFKRVRERARQGGNTDSE